MTLGAARSRGCSFRRRTSQSPVRYAGAVHVLVMHTTQQGPSPQAPWRRSCSSIICLDHSSWRFVMNSAASSSGKGGSGGNVGGVGIGSAAKRGNERPAEQASAPVGRRSPRPGPGRRAGGACRGRGGGPVRRIHVQARGRRQAHADLRGSAAVMWARGASLAAPNPPPTPPAQCPCLTGMPQAHERCSTSPLADMRERPAQRQLRSSGGRPALSSHRRTSSLMAATVVAGCCSFRSMPCTSAPTVGSTVSWYGRGMACAIAAGTLQASWLSSRVRRGRLAAAAAAPALPRHRPRAAVGTARSQPDGILIAPGAGPSLSNNQSS